MPGTVWGIWLYSKKQTNKYSFGTQILVKGDIYMINNNTDEEIYSMLEDDYENNEIKTDQKGQK